MPPKPPARLLGLARAFGPSFFNFILIFSSPRAGAERLTMCFPPGPTRGSEGVSLLKVVGLVRDPARVIWGA